MSKISSQYDYPLSPPNMRKYASSDSASLFLFFYQPTARPGTDFLRSVLQITSFRTTMCLLGVSETKFYISMHPPQKTEILGKFLGQKISAQHGLNNGVLTCKLNRHRSPTKVVWRIRKSGQGTQIWDLQRAPIYRSRDPAKL